MLLATCWMPRRKAAVSISVSKPEVTLVFGRLNARVSSLPMTARADEAAAEGLRGVLGLFRYGPTKIFHSVIVMGHYRLLESAA